MPTTTKKKSCPKGQIMRKGYTRKAYVKADGTKIKATRVPPICVKDQGAPGKGPKTLPPIKDKGFLTQFGYHLKLTSTERRSALRKAVRKYGGLAVIRHLNLIRNYNKNNKSAHAKYTSDLEYVSELYKERKEKGTAKKSTKK